MVCERDRCPSIRSWDGMLYVTISELQGLLFSHQTLWRLCCLYTDKRSLVRAYRGFEKIYRVSSKVSARLTCFSPLQSPQLMRMLEIIIAVVQPLLVITSTGYYEATNTERTTPWIASLFHLTALHVYDLIIGPNPSATAEAGLFLFLLILRIIVFTASNYVNFAYVCILDILDVTFLWRKFWCVLNLVIRDVSWVTRSYYR